MTPTALIIGCGDDTGAAIARAFAREGLHVCISRRPRHVEKLEKLAQDIEEMGGQATPCPVDARDENALTALFETIENNIGPLEVVIFNIGANVRFPISDTTSRIFRKVWEMATFAGFLTGREAAKHMLGRGRGTIIFTGATASLRGSSGFSAFASAKFALRALAQSMARELGPKNIHVAHVVIDGAINTDFIRGILPDIDAKRTNDAILNPDDVAQNYVMLHNQPRTAWTHELDLRPWSEKF